MEEKTKKCTKCGEVKPITEFYKRGKYYQSYCKACDYEKCKKRRKERRKANPYVRRGVIYSEMTNSGRCSTRYVRGCKPIYCFRWVGEISINGRRHRFRSTNRNNVEAWLNDMINKAADIPIVRTNKNEENNHTKK